jgi:hypothetical protein
MLQLSGLRHWQQQLLQWPQWLVPPAQGLQGKVRQTCALLLTMRCPCVCIKRMELPCIHVCSSGCCACWQNGGLASRVAADHSCHQLQ